MTPPPGRNRSVPPRLRAAAAVGAAGAVYFVLACLIYWPAAPLDAGRLPGCACGDAEQQTWFLAWVSYALTHAHNPFLTSYLHAPLGANLAIDTSMPLLGVLGMPVTLLAGPVATFNLLLRLGLAASGASMFGVLRRYVSWWPAAFLGGLMFAFSPYLADQAVRHLFLSFVPLVPLFIPLLDDWLIRRTRAPLRSGLLIGLVAALQYLISPEIVLTCAMMAVAGLAFLALRYRGAVAERIGTFARGAAAAVGVFLLIAGYGVFVLLAGPDRPQGPVHTLSNLTRYHGDLLSPLYPTVHQLFAPAALASVGNRLPTGRTIEDGFYLGFPLLVLLSYLVIRCRRAPLAGVAVVIGVTAFILGLGARLTVDGRTLPIPLPFAILTHVPVLQNLEAARLSLFIQLAAAIILAMGLDQVRARGWLPAGSPAVVAAVGLAALLPLVPHIPIRTDRLETPGFFTSPSVRAVPEGAVALALPFDIAPQNDPMMWQIASGMRFRILGGDVFVPGPGGRSTWHPLPAGPLVLRVVLEAGQYPRSSPPPLTMDAVRALRALIVRTHVSVVIVNTAAHNGLALSVLARSALRAPPWPRGQLDVWLNVQRDLRRPPA